jgi:hypothetical protein
MAPNLTGGAAILARLKCVCRPVVSAEAAPCASCMLAALCPLETEHLPRAAGPRRQQPCWPRLLCP